MEGAISREEHEAFKERIDSENARQNERLKELEETVHQINSLTISVEKMAVSMDGMLKELTEQSQRMEKLEGRDGENWKKVIGGIITGIVGGLIVFVMAKLGLG